MKDQQIIEAIKEYRVILSGKGKVDFPHDHRAPCSEAAIEHVHGMLDRMEDFVKEGKTEKAFRWLGFVQGILWACGYYTIEELRHHNH